MLLLRKIVYISVICMFFLPCFSVFGQAETNSYQKWWKAINTDTVSVQKKLHYLELYLQQARKENNLLEEYRVLKEKTYILPFNEAVMILPQMHRVAQQAKNDSLSGNYLNRSAVLYYKHRYFDEALNYAIQSEAFNEKNKNLYNLNSVRLVIGNIYYHTRHYEKAEEYFTKAKDFYKNQKGNNYIRGYVNCLYSLGKTYLELKKTEELKNVIAESEAKIPLLKEKHRQLETAYIEYLKGGLAFCSKIMSMPNAFLKQHCL